MPQIVPIRDLRDTTKLSEMCHKVNEPIFVTKNGYGDLVVMSMDCFESIMSRQKIYDEITKGLAQSENGETFDGEKVMDELWGKYGRKA